MRANSFVCGNWDRYFLTMPFSVGGWIKRTRLSVNLFKPSAATFC